MDQAKIKVLIIDDEPLARDYIRHLLKEDPQIEIAGEASNGKKALKLISELDPDLIFLDVQMPEMTGFELLKTLDGSQIPAVVFTTAYEEYAIRAFEFHAIDYLLKPFDRHRFSKALEHARSSIVSKDLEGQTSQQILEMLKSSERESQHLERILIKQNGKVIFLKITDIDFIKADDKYIHLYFNRSNYLVRQTLTAILSQLDPGQFIQIHRSVIVNIDSILELHKTFNGRYNVILKNGAEHPLSRKYQDRLFELLGDPI